MLAAAWVTPAEPLAYSSISSLVAYLRRNLRLQSAVGPEAYGALSRGGRIPCSRFDRYSSCCLSNCRRVEPVERHVCAGRGADAGSVQCLWRARGSARCAARRKHGRGWEVWRTGGCGLGADSTAAGPSRPCTARSDGWRIKQKSEAIATPVGSGFGAAEDLEMASIAGCKGTRLLAGGLLHAV